MVGFTLNKEGRVLEHLPQNEQFSTPKEKRSIFFNLYNYYVEKEMRLTKEEMQNGENIHEVFQHKIESLKEKSLRQKFIHLIGTGGRAKLLFDLDDMFLHLVYERAKKVNPKADVLLFENTIVIKDHRDDVSSTLLIPSYMKLERVNIMSDPTVKKQMDEACRTLNETEIKQVFLVYPKHPKFMKHITVDLHNKVNLRDEEYRVKMIPYSFSFCTKKQNIKTKTKNRRQECQ